MGALTGPLFIVTCLTVTQAVIFQGGKFREEYVCQVGDRLIGTCRSDAGCTAGTGRGVRRVALPKQPTTATCGLPGAEELRCCAPHPAPPPPSAQAGHGRRSRQACQQYNDTSAARTCDNLRSSADNRVRVGEYPYFAAIGYQSKSESTGINWACGGGLISESFVLTVAVCAKGYSQTGGPTTVRLGDVDLKSRDDDEDAQEFGVAEIFIHPEYTYPSHYNDIALLKLSGKVIFTKAVRPACLYGENIVPVSRAVVAGAGQTSQGGVGILHKVDVPITSADKCREEYKNRGNTLRKGIDDLTMICAGEQGKDACVGDSGAFLVVKAGAPLCTYEAIGLASFGPSPCGSARMSAVYTRIYPYLQWIEQVVWPHE